MVNKRSASVTPDRIVRTLFSTVLADSGYDAPKNSSRAEISALSKHDPAVLLMDFDHTRTDPLESVRQVRFVLPECSIAVVSKTIGGDWARKCHMAGANAVLQSGQLSPKMVLGLRKAIATGCFTDEAFVKKPRSGNGST